MQENVTLQFFILLAETRLWFSFNDKFVPRMQESFCVGEFSVAGLIIILEISHAPPRRQPSSAS
jgi:hypothetical protein